MKRVVNRESNSGISLITVIITIVVIIILAAISFVTVQTQKQSLMARYVQEFEELRKGIETKRLSNAKTRS